MVANNTTYRRLIHKPGWLVTRWTSKILYIWWHHQMETFSALLAICVGNSSVSGELSAQRPETRSFNVFFDLRLNKPLSKQRRGWWFETLSRPLWRHGNDFDINQHSTHYFVGSDYRRLSLTGVWIFVWLQPLLQCIPIFQSPYHRPFVRGTHWLLVDSPRKRPVERKSFPCHDVILPAGWDGG